MARCRCPHFHTNNLPRLQPFFGRAAELATLREALDPDSRTWGALIDGPGGMGKTSLAVRAAYDCRPGLFQRIVFVSVKIARWTTASARSATSSCRASLRCSMNSPASWASPTFAKSPRGPAHPAPARRAPPRAGAAHPRSSRIPPRDRTLAGFHLRQTPAAGLQGHPHQPPPHRLRLRGTHPRKARPGRRARHPRRPRPAPSAARPHQRSRAHRPYTQTAGKPLLLRWWPVQLGRGRCRTFADALAFLRTCPPDNDPLEFIFGDLAKEFTTDEEKVLCALTYFSFPAKVEHLPDIGQTFPRRVPFCARKHDALTMDTRTPEQRHRIMAAVKGRDTGPELIVRRILFAAGFRYRLHVASLPGRPDIVLPKWRAVIFVHGCFWHGHRCRKGRLPRSRQEFWGDKITRNRERDAASRRALKRLSWRVLVVW